MKFYNHIVMVAFLFVSVAPVCAKSTKMGVFFGGALSSASKTMSSWKPSALSGVSALSNETKIAVGGLALLTGGYFGFKWLKNEQKRQTRYKTGRILSELLKEGHSKHGTLGERNDDGTLKGSLEGYEGHSKIQKKTFNEYLLIKASGLGKEAKVKSLLDDQVGIDTYNKVGFTPLMAASFCGQEAIVNLLLGRGAKVDLQDKDGRTALMLGILQARIIDETIIPSLLKWGANPNKTDEDGNTALMLAVLHKKQGAVEAFGRYERKEGQSPIDFTIKNRSNYTIFDLTRMGKGDGIGSRIKMLVELRYALQVLGFTGSDEVNSKTIKKAYKILALKYHPDKQSIDATDEQKKEAESKFKELNEANDKVKPDGELARYFGIS